MSQRQIAAKMNCSQVNVRYWLRKHQLKTISKVKPTSQPAIQPPSRERFTMPAPPNQVPGDTNLISAATESTVLAALIKAGYPCYVPFGVGKADLVMETVAGLRTVQCKTARLANGVLTFSTGWWINGQRKRAGYEGLVDYFAVTSPNYSGVFLVPVDDLPPGSGSLRIKPTINGQRKGIRFADEYLVEGSRAVLL